MIILSFDIGIKNMAWSMVSSLNPYNVDINSISNQVSIYSFDTFDPSHTIMHKVYQNLHSYLKSKSHYWDKADIILIEQQMSTKFIHNIKALKLSQHIYAYFLITYPHKKVIEFKAKWKTSIFNVYLPSKTDRKKWSIQKIYDLYEQDPVIIDFLNCYSKKDDITDTLLMGIVYFIMNSSSFNQHSNIYSTSVHKKKIINTNQKALTNKLSNCGSFIC